MCTFYVQILCIRRRKSKASRNSIDNDRCCCWSSIISLKIKTLEHLFWPITKVPLKSKAHLFKRNKGLYVCEHGDYITRFVLSFLVFNWVVLFTRFYSFIDKVQYPLQKRPDLLWFTVFSEEITHDSLLLCCNNNLWSVCLCSINRN